MILRVPVIMLLGLALLVARPVPLFAQTAEMQRHPLETRALTEPQAVLAELPPLIAAARAANNQRELALLYLAESNACRVNAIWPCQTEAAARARAAAEAAQSPALQIRGLILESRGWLAMQDFSRASRVLGYAERLLGKYPNAEASADIYLAYSSLSYSVGKHAKAGEYAELGLKALGDLPAPTVRIRLMRNQARAMSQLDNTPGAREVLKKALALVETVKDPKLSAELYLEDARIARLSGDVPTQIANGKRILELATHLSNSQLDGLGHETLGLAALNRGDNANAERELRQANESFRGLKLDRDERRVLRALIRSMLGRGAPRAELEALVNRNLTLESSLEASDRNLAADDFESRLKYAQQELDVQRLETAAELAKQRESSLAEQQRLTQIVAALSLVLLLVFGMLFLLQRRFNVRLRQANARLAESEGRYRMLADNSRDMVVRMLLTGKRLYVSPASRDLLGLEPSEFSEPRWDLVHPDDRERMAAAIRDLGETGGAKTIVYRALHANGHYVWIEVAARLVPPQAEGGQPEIVYSGRDVTARVHAEQALSEREAFMRAVTDNIPAMIVHLDKEQRYTFANALIADFFGMSERDMIGRSVREVRGEAAYAELKPHIDAVLAGQHVEFEWAVETTAGPRHFQANYVPDLDAAGAVRGFFALLIDISELKAAQGKLDQLARIDSLSGVANRRDFEERLAGAFARSRRQGTPLALLCFDIDHFKAINDQHGHLAGDAVITAFAQRLRSCVREGDLVARLGGDEFALLIENPAAKAGENVARKLLEIMTEPLSVDGLPLQVTASVGVAYSTEAPSANALIDLADRALYAAKESGRNTFRIA